jgi:hypothetical protein
MAADRPAVRPLDTLKVRGRLRAAWLALWLAGAAECIGVGVCGDTPEDTLGSHQIFLSLFLFFGCSVGRGCGAGFGRGLDADGNCVVVRNALWAISIPWRELAAIEFKGVDSVAISDMYCQLVFQRHDGSRVTAEAPGGGARPGEYLFELRERLLAMRYAATWPLVDASNPTTPTDTPPTTATWPLLEEPALPPAETGQLTDRPAGPLVSGAILSVWAEWADSTRFATTALFLQGYATAEVDAFQRAIRDTFLGVRHPSVVSGHVHGKQFSTLWAGRPIFAT